MDANLVALFGTIFTSVAGLIIALYTQKTSARKDALDVQGELIEKLTKELECERAERRKLQDDLDAERKERQRLQAEWEKERTQMQIEINDLRAKLAKRKGDW